jgi:hypothetical protein
MRFEFPVTFLEKGPPWTSYPISHPVPPIQAIRLKTLPGRTGKSVIENPEAGLNGEDSLRQLSTALWT